MRTYDRNYTYAMSYANVLMATLAMSTMVVTQNPGLSDYYQKKGIHVCDLKVPSRLEIIAREKVDLRK